MLNNLSNSSSEMIKVWDPIVRIFHWLLVGGVIATFLITGDDWLKFHIITGYLIFILIIIRIIWGLIGSHHARFNNFIKSPVIIYNYLKTVLQHRAPRYLGHNPAGGAMVIILLIMVTATGVTGLLLYGAQEFAGPLAWIMINVSDDTAHFLEKIHDILAKITIALGGVHLIGVILTSLTHRENLIGAMFTGNKRKEIYEQKTII